MIIQPSLYLTPAKSVQEKMDQKPPLILTLQLNPEAFAFFNGLRQHHFPRHLNFLAAHVTLFHHLPNAPFIAEYLHQVAGQQEIIPLSVASVIKLGRGVGYKLKSPALQHLQNRLKQEWHPYLTPQDRQGFRAHVTVQNKVDPAQALKLFEELSASFRPFEAQGVGLGLWEYLGGPWRPVQEFNFRG
jgi:hypothetical protein